MKKITVNVAWCEGNFACSFSDNVPGAVVVTMRNFYELLIELKFTLFHHLLGMNYCKLEVPQWIDTHDYELVLKFEDISTVLHAYETFLSLTGISRVTGIKESRLLEYANGLKKPRIQHRRKIVYGLNSLGSQLCGLKMDGLSYEGKAI